MSDHRARGAWVPGVGQFNEGVVLELIRRAPEGTSRSRIAQSSGLSPQTVSTITRRLIDNALVQELRGAATGPGKPATVLRLNPHSRFAIGVHLDPAELSAVVLDLTGETRATVRRVVGDRSPAGLMGEIAVLVADVISQAEVDHGAVVGVGVASPGPIDPDHGTVDPPTLAGWDHVPLRETLHRLTGLPVVIERDVDAAVIGELWLHPDDGDDLLFIYYGTGLNSGIALNRQVLHGGSGRPGRLAHVWSGGGGTRCSCGKFGCLGHNLAPAQILHRATSAGLAVPTKASERDRLAALVRSAEKDRTAARILADVGQRLAEGIAVFAPFLDLSRVVIGGPLWSTVAPAARDALQRRLAAAEDANRFPSVRLAEAGVDDPAAVGAGCLMLDTAFSPRPDALLTR